jgi:hypothetical protein
MTFTVDPQTPTTTADTTVPRCCSRHEDWTTLGAHLVAGFSDVPPLEIAGELLRARTAATEFRLPDADALEVAEIVVRHQMLIRTGRLVDNARLDPESHQRRP